MRLYSKVAGIVLKRTNVGETDRIINLLTREHGKMTCVAKGVRKLKSSKRALLEPGNYVQAFLVHTKSLPLLTQATMIDDCKNLGSRLIDYRKLMQLLEVFEKLFVESELEGQLFDQVLSVRTGVINNSITTTHLTDQLGQIIVNLGFQHPHLSKYDTITSYISALSNQPMHSFEFLQVKK